MLRIELLVCRRLAVSVTIVFRQERFGYELELVVCASLFRILGWKSAGDASKFSLIERNLKIFCSPPSFFQDDNAWLTRDMLSCFALAT